MVYLVASSTQTMKVVEIIARKLTNECVRYVFAGSVSSFIQGCEIAPGDIDLLVPESNDVHKVALILGEFINENSNNEETLDESWFSTVASPIKTFTDFADNQWTFARLMVHGMKLVVANIQSKIQNEYIYGSGFWENGPQVWEHINFLPYLDLSLPVIPLEIQLETNMNRNLESRIKEISRVLQARGYNEGLINYALNEGNRVRFQEILKGSH
jgi:hypothetical protein